MKKVIFIVLSIFIMLSATVYMAITITRNSLKTFTKSGYILSSEKLSGNKQNKTEKYYFTADTNYKNSYDETINFKDNNGDKVKVSQASFIHYMDDSISLLKKGVIFNLLELNSEIPKYYNLFEGTVLENVKGTYYVDNLGKKLKFKKFIVRISETKYLVVSDSIFLKLDNEHTIDVKSNYIELNFVEGGIVRIENQEATYQTIAKNALIDLGNDITLNLDNEHFYYKEEAKLSLAQIIIDSDDNIDITPIEEEKEEEKTPEPEENEENNTTGGSNDSSGTAGGNAGSLEGNIEIEEEVQEEQLRLPTATVNDMVITSNKMEASIKIVDEDSLIIGTSLTTITENSTGKIVYSKETDAGTYGIDITVENLTPETTYSLVTRVTYKKHDVEYVMDIVQQLFQTESLGLSISKDYYTDDSLAFLVRFDSYSKVKSADVVLNKSTGEEVKVISVTDEFAQSDLGCPVTFDRLESDTKYIVTVKNILYDNYIVSDDYAIEMSAKTLKEKPVMGDINFSIDKKNSLFTLRLNNVVDPNNGVENYRYEIYDARTYDEDATPITTIEKKNTASIDLDVDNKIIYRSVPYIFRVVAEFYDNEKYIEYTTKLSDTMRMDGVEAPSVSWKADEITFERISGTLTINDPGNTVDMDKQMTIVYTNSIGTTNSFTTAGNTVIPFAVNNLRANETYTISVYASVNLQDDNPTVDKYHVGSVIVKTKPTNPFEATFEVNTENVKTVFEIDSKLINVSEADNTLEATTLTGLTFTLYEGTTVNGRVIKTIKKVDRDLREYYSDLKTAYYDNTFALNPDFFGVKNSDLISDYYTISITNAYDYTDFQNEIGIKNNIVTVKSNGFIPDLPENPEDAIDYQIIRNKDAGEHADEELAADTIVGIRIKATYDNAKRYLKHINYHVFDADTGKELKNYLTKYEASDSGEIEYVEFYLKNGTTFKVEDTELRRGHRYYFTYDAALDLNGDGEIDTRYPAKEDIILKSKVIDFPKQEAIITTYPSTSSNDTMTFKYTYSDIDHALVEPKLYANIGKTPNESTNVNEKNIFITQNDTEGTVTFNNLSPGYLSVYSKQALLKKESSVNNKRYIFQYFEGLFEPKKLSYTVMLDVNRIIISINNYANEQEMLSRVAALKLTFKCGDKKVVKDNIRLIGDNAVVDMFDLSEFLGKPVTVRVEAYYDTGVTGYDTQIDNYALQSVLNEYGGGKYFSINSLGNLVENDTAMGAIYQKEINDNNIKLTNMMSGRSISFPKKPTEGGIMFNYEHMLLKELKTIEFSGDSSSTFVFNQIIPGISLRDDEDNEQITPTIRSVAFKADIYGFGSSNIKDSIVYMQLFKSDENGLNLEEVDTYSYTLDQLQSTIEVTDLLPRQNYAMQFYAYIDDGHGNYEKKRLYDIDDNSNSKTYYFKTLSSVNIQDVSVKYSAISYNEKYLTLSYQLDKIMGYDRIRYKLYRRVYNEEKGEFEFVLMKTKISEDVGFKTNMIRKIPCNPGSEFVFGSQYKLDIIPIVDIEIDGVKREIELDGLKDYIFNLTALKTPYVGITSVISSDESATTGSALDFKVNIYDTDKIIVGGTYQIAVSDVNGRDITPEKYKGEEFSITKYNRIFTVDKLEQGQTYLFKVIYNTDKRNDINSAEEVTKIYRANSLNKNGIDIGTLSSSSNSEVKNKIDITFRNSYRLTKVDTIRYSIYNSSNGTSQDNTLGFNPVQKTINGETIYILTLPEFLAESGVYYIQIQFISEGFVVNETTVEHTYIAEEN